MEDRKGFLTPKHEGILDDLYKGKGIDEVIDGPSIRLLDNQVLERLKKKLPEDAIPVVYEIVDEIFIALEAIVKK